MDSKTTKAKTDETKGQLESVSQAAIEALDARAAKTLDPASEAWIYIHRIHWAEKPRFMSIGQEFDLAPQQAMALRVLSRTRPLPMGELAKLMLCDSSNVTGIVDRLEERDLVERRALETDRRVKLLVLTDEGYRIQQEIERRITTPPAVIAALPETDQRRLAEILRRALQHEDAGGEQ